MAKVFISYRRADGQHAVGWLAQRLATLTEDPTVEIAFRDGDLLGGDNFHLALADKVGNCEILIAVIGPHWLGERDGQPNRILDPSDWVGREITSALKKDIVIIPVLINGAEPISTDDVVPEHAELAKKNARQFDTEEDLDKILDDVTKQLARIDFERARQEAQRARLSGLLGPIKLGRAMSPPVALGLACLGALVGGALGIVLTRVISNAPTTFWSVATTAQLTLCGASGAIGLVYLMRRFGSRVRIRWRPVMLTILAIVSIILWGATQYGGLFNGNDSATVIVAGLTLVLAGPWVIAGAGSAWTEVHIDEYRTRERTEVIMMLSRAGLIASSVLGLIAASAVVTSAAALDRTMTSPGEARSTIVTYGVLLSVMIGAILIYGRTRLETDSMALMESISDLKDRYKDKVERKIVTEPVAPEVRWMIAPIALPLIVGIAMAIAYTSF